MQKTRIRFLQGMSSHQLENDVVLDKLDDACTPGFAVPFTPGEARRAGAFSEEAVSEADAAASCIDLPQALERLREHTS